jgi:hypothetical protein
MLNSSLRIIAIIGPWFLGVVRFGEVTILLRDLFDRFTWHESTEQMRRAMRYMARHNGLDDELNDGPETEPTMRDEY